jgi:fructose-1,6-bisphosphatase/inositol monophosphatase family enzyme
MRNPEFLLQALQRIHCAIRDAVVQACEATALEQMATVTAFEGGDTIYAIDRVSEAVLLTQFADLAQHYNFRLVAEGLGHDGIHDFPTGVAESALELVIIVDPIDGTRGLMYQKRSAWILTGVAPYRGAHTNLRDIGLAVMTEIPLVKQHLCDTLWAIAGHGAHASRFNRITDTTQSLPIRPSQATTILNGFGNIARFFPGERARLAAVDDLLTTQLLGEAPQGRALSFEDQYISTGGQLYEILMGHDRWLADVRPLLLPPSQRHGETPMLCCHPYDMCTELIAREAGAIVCKANGQPLDAPLDVQSGVSWVAVANQTLAARLLPALQQALQAYDMQLEDDDVAL